MSFFKKIVSDAIPFREKKKKTQTKGKDKNDDSDDEKSGNCIKVIKCTDVHFGTKITLTNTNVYNNVTAEPTNQQNDPSEPTLPVEIEKHFSSTESPYMYHFILVSRNLKKGCVPLGKRLGFSEIELEKYSDDEENFVRMLLNWKNSKTSEATIGRLMNSLWNAGEYEAAKRLSAAIESNEEQC